MKAIVVLMLLMGSLGCSSDREQPEEPIKIYLTQGLWIVEYYELNNENITDQFADVTLKFNKNGEVIFTQNNVTTNGSWNYRYERVPETVYSISYFSMNFNSNDTAKLLNQEWDTSNIGPDVVSGGNSQSWITIIKIE